MRTQNPMKEKRFPMASRWGVGVAGMLFATVAQADPLPPFQGPIDSDDPPTWRFTPEVREQDFFMQVGYLLPRAPALVWQVQQAARAGLVSWRERGVDLRDTRIGDHGGGLWARLHYQGGDRGLRLADLSLNDALGSGASVSLDGFEGEIRDELNALFSDLLDDPDIDAGELQDLINAAVDGAFDLSHDQSHYGFNVGFDLIRGSAGSRAWLVGASAGYLRSRTEFDDFDRWDLGSQFDGDAMNLGLYGGVVAGGFYADLALSYAWHSLDLDLPLMALRPAGSVLSTNARTLSAQVDAGLRVSLFRDSLPDWGLYIEPVAGMVWVRTDVDEMNIQPADSIVLGSQGNRLVFDRQGSLRGNLGLRLGTEWRLPGELGLSAELGVRQWREFERRSAVGLSLRGEREDLTIPGREPVPGYLRVLDMTGALVRSLTDISASVGLRNSDGRVSGALNVGHLRGSSDLSSLGVGVNFRYQW